jgi:anti-sigma factor ChrR (cupin superfamily)
MSAHVLDRLPEYALGLVDEAERAAIELHVQACTACYAAARAEEDALAGFALHALRPVAASPEARLRLLQATRPVQPIALLDETDRLARFFDLPLAEARTIVEKAANPASWAPAPFPGLHLLHVAPGPAYVGADAGLVRFEPSSQFPLHDHQGVEHTLMLSGGLTFADGQRLVPGDAALIVQPGQKHAFTVFPEGCVYGLILYGGIYIDGIGKIGTRS